MYKANNAFKYIIQYESDGRVHRGMWAEYCDRGYKYDKDFAESSKPKWYVIGNNIDLIEMVRQPNGKVRVFSDDGKFISQDCRHLTKAGAKFYANRINWNRFLN